MKRDIPMLTTRAKFEPSSLDADARTVDLVWTTGARGKRRSYFGDYYEELGMRSKEVRLERAKGGLPFVDGHRSWDNSAVIGRAEKIRIQKQEDGTRVGVATVRFDTSELAEQRLQSVRNGILRDISVGYQVHRYDRVEEIEEAGEKVPVFRATDWEPMEISLVTVPFDRESKIRSEGDDPKYACEFPDAMVARDETDASAPAEQNREAPHMSGVVDAAPKAEQETIDVEAVRREALEAERGRVADIHAACKRAGMPELAEDFIRYEKSIDQVREVLIDKMAERNVDVSPATVIRDESETRNEGIVHSVLCRAQPHLFKHNDNSRRFARYSLVDIAREVTGEKGAGAQVVTNALTRAYQTTSSFTDILEDIQNKSLRAEYDAQVGSFEPFVRRSTLNDFRPTSRARLGDMGDLLEMPEGAEFGITEASDSTEKIQLKTYGRKIGLSRQAIINDDLDAFSRFPQQFATKARNLEANLVYGVITDNADMSDGIALFQTASHGNLAAAAAAISVTTLGKAMEAMRLQTTESGMPINVMPRYLVVPPQLETVALQYVAQIVPEAGSNVNPFSGRFQVIVDPRLYTLTNGSATAWYLFADPGQIDTIELASLAGGEGINLDRMDDDNTLGVWWKAYVDRGAKAIDWRGLYKNAGA